MVFVYLAYKSQFGDKSVALIDNAIALRMLRLHLERLSDIALSKEDQSFGESLDRETKLKGNIELRDLFYRYAPSDPPVLEGVYLSIEKGEFVAITGPSGGGKSTLVKLILGLVEPENGKILIDGLPLNRFGYKSYHRQVGTVLQEDNLFAGTLAENIALFEESVDIERVIGAATAASIHGEIDQMPMKYETFVGDMGSTLSGGQKQRVLLTRALYRQPKMLVMDEGTAHLDARHEKIVNEAISARGITRIIIAHRKETIELADSVMVMLNRHLYSIEELTQT